jgi:hypothetical protein
VRTHAARAAALLEQVAREVAAERFLGLELAEVRRQALAVAERPPQRTAEVGAPAEVVFDFVLWPAPQP